MINLISDRDRQRLITETINQINRTDIESIDILDGLYLLLVELELSEFKFDQIIGVIEDVLLFACGYNFDIPTDTIEKYFVVIEYLVKRFNIDITFQDNYLIQLACYHGSIELVKYLLDCGANLQDDDYLGLFWAAEHNHLQLLEYLIPYFDDWIWDDSVSISKEATEFLIKHKVIRS